MMPKVLSLFTGAGGLDLGFAKAGFEIAASSDCIPLFCETIELNQAKYYGNAHKSLCKSIVDIEPSNIGPLDIDVVIGGPPCQSFSAAGRRAGGVNGVNDFRGSLFWHYCRLIRDIQPRVFVFENVRGMLQANKGEDWKVIRSHLESLGYQLNFRLLDAADYGVPQHRERLVVVGSSQQIDSYLFPRPTHGPDSKSGQQHIGVGESISDLQDPDEVIPDYGGKYGDLIKEVPPGMNYLHFTEEMGHPKPRFAWRSRFSDFLWKADPELPCKTLVASPSKYSGPFHWKGRKFTLPELKRIQSFDDDYQFAGSTNEVIKQIGNSVAPKFAFHIAKSILRQAFNDTNSDIDLMPNDCKLSFDKAKGAKARRTRKIASRPLQPPTLFDALEGNPKPRALARKTFAEKWRYSEPRKQTNCVRNAQFGAFSIRGSLSQSTWKLKVRRLGIKRSESKDHTDINLEFDRLVSGTFNKIQCRLTSTSIWDVCIAWDAIHHVVCQESSFDDLHPLYGHFTEPYPKFKIDAISTSNCSAVRFLEWSTNYRNLSETHDLSLLDELITGDDCKSHEQSAQLLRNYGFDVRTNNTNRTIPTGMFRLCYPFVISLANPISIPWIDQGSHIADQSSIPQAAIE